jgi:hypothetical protein
MEIRRATVFLIRLRALPGVDDDIRALRAALKTLLRRYELKALSVEVETANQQEANNDRRD